MRARILSAALLALLLAAPMVTAIAQRGDTCQSDAVCRVLDQNIGLKTPITLAQLRTFSHLDGEERAPITNAHVAGQTDTIHELRYKGLTIKAYVPNDGPALLQEIVVTGAQPTLPLKLVFGKSTLDDVLHALGFARETEHLQGGASRWSYENVEHTASVVFEFEPEPSMRIRRVEWRFNTD